MATSSPEIFGGDFLYALMGQFHLMLYPIYNVVTYINFGNNAKCT
jgi:hypothetical protein